MKTHLLALCFLMFLACVAGAGTRLDELAWMAGTWRGRMGRGDMEESWTPRVGPSMLGTFRLTEGGAAKFYEFMVLEMSKDGPVMRIRHFEPDLTAWEDKTGALPFQLVAATKNRAVFEDRTKSPVERLTYTRRGNALTILLEVTKAGKPESSTFRFRRE